MTAIRQLSDWQPRRRPQQAPMQGRYVRLEPLDAEAHGEGLLHVATEGDGPQRYHYLPDSPPDDIAEFRPWLEKAQASSDPLFFTCIDRSSGRIAGRQTLMRIDTANGSIEIGNILWGAIIARRPAATEAFYLFARHVFDDLGYRRFEWKCDNDNEPSKRAARRFGMKHEGVFRQHMIVKGRNRDTAWFSIIDSEWPRIGKAMAAWLDPVNFDESGTQRSGLGAFMQG